MQVIWRRTGKGGGPSAAATLVGVASHRPARVRPSLPRPRPLRNRGASAAVEHRRGLFHRPQTAHRVPTANRHQPFRQLGERPRRGDEQRWLQPSQSSAEARFGPARTDP